MCWYNSIILYDIHDIDIWYWYWLLDLQVEEMYRGEFDIGAEKKLSLNIEDTRYVLMIIVVVVQRWSSWQLFWDSCSWIRLSCGCGSAHCVQKLFQWKEQNKCSDDLFSSGTFAWDFPAMVEVSLSAADAVLLVFSHVNPLSPLSTHLTNAL